MEIFLDQPDITDAEIQAVRHAMRADISVRGSLVPKFERRVAEFLGVEDAVAVNSGTSALYLALKAAGVRPGDEVIIPNLTFEATANAATMLGAKVILVDVDPDTWTILPGAVEQHISPGTRTVIPVHLYGNPCEMDRLQGIAATKGIVIVEDACEAFGAKWDDQLIGTIGGFGCFSFNRNKVPTCLGGGVVVSRSKRALDKIRAWADQGLSNFYMTEEHAAIGLVQMDRLSEMSLRKRSIARHYRAELGEMVDFQEYPGSGGAAFERSTHWMTACTFPDDTAEHIISKLADRGIPSRRLFEPLDMTGELKETQELWTRGVCLPSSTKNSTEAIEHVCKAIKEIVT